MEKTVDFLHRLLANNPVWVWFLALGLLLGVYGALWGLRRGLSRWFSALYERRKTRTWQLASDLIRRANRLFLFAVALFAASFSLYLPPQASRAIHLFVLSAFLLQLASWASRILSFWFLRLSERKLKEEGDAASATVLNALAVIVKIVLWVVAFILILENFGIRVSTLVAGLGIAGVAVALAVQEVLKDLLASLSIVVDKPFMVGDFLVFGDKMGTVERIGLKSTRIRSLTGEQIIVSNADLLRERIHNYKRMRERRVAFTFGVVYDTPPERLAAIPRMVEEIIAAQPMARFERAHFKEFGPYSLNFEVVYWIQDPDYKLYMDTQQAINLALVRKFREEGIKFALPTQVIQAVGGREEKNGDPEAYRRTP